MANICVFTGWAKAFSPELEEAIILCGKSLAARGHNLIMGGIAGGSMKLMGTSYLEAGGPSMTIIYPEEYASYELAGHQPHPKLTPLPVPNLHQRLEKMITRADGFLAFPGGYGTLHEIFQVAADNQACLYHNNGRPIKPMVIYNPAGFFDSMLEQISTCHREGYVPAGHLDLLRHISDPALLIPTLEEALTFG